MRKTLYVKHAALSARGSAFFCRMRWLRLLCLAALNIISRARSIATEVSNRDYMYYIINYMLYIYIYIYIHM